MTEGTGTDYALAAEVIAKFEGYAAKAYWDVNAWRIGYGSDTRFALGQFVRVHKGDETTRAAAIVDLQHRIPQFERVIIRQVGLGTWTHLPQKVRAALLSIAYNYGHLPHPIDSVVAHGGSLSGIAKAVEAREHDNRGINANRRVAEANIIRSA